MEKLTPVPKITVGELRQHLEIFEDDTTGEVLVDNVDSKDLHRA